MATLVNIQVFTQEKKDGVITKSDALALDPCSTLDMDRFYTARSTSKSSFDFLQKFKPMQCLDEKANIKLTPTRQQSNQVVSVGANARVSA